MPSFSTPLEKSSSGFLRPVVPVAIIDASRLAPASTRSAHEQTGSYQGRVVRGLVDSGASITCITAALADELKIPSHGQRAMASASERNVQKNLYRIAVIIMAHGQVTVPDTTQPQNIMSPISAPSIVEASEFVNLGEGDVEVLIGMDIIKLSVMTISGHDQRLTMSF